MSAGVVAWLHGLRVYDDACGPEPLRTWYTEYDTEDDPDPEGWCGPITTTSAFDDMEQANALVQALNAGGGRRERALRECGR